MAYLGRPGATAPLTSADIPDNSITAAKIVDATIAAGDLAPNSVDSSELVDGSVDNSHLADDAVGTDELANDVIINTSGAITTTGGMTVDGATVFNEASADVDFRVESNGNANMLVVDASADMVGIGVADPHTTLEVNGSISCGSDQATPVAALYVRTSHATQYAAHIENTHTEKGHGLHVASNADEVDEYILKCTNGASATVLCATGNGNVGIGTSSPDHAFCSEDAGGAPGSFYRVHSSTGAGVLNCYSNVSSTKNHIFAIEADGDVFNETGSYSSGTSDERLKTDIQDTSTKLDKLLALPIKTFCKISRPDLKMIGVIAQDLEKVLPNLVETVEVTEETGKAQKDEDGKILLNDDEKPYVLDKDGNKLTSYKRTKDSLLLFCAIKAIQELSAKVTALENT